MSSKTRQNLQSDIKRSRRLELVQRSKTGNFGTNSSSSIQSYGTTAGSNEKRRKRPASATRNRRLHTYDEEDRTMLNSDGGSPVATKNHRRRRTYTYDDEEDEVTYSPVSARPQSAQRQRSINNSKRSRRPQSATLRRRFDNNEALARQIDRKNVPEALSRSKQLLEEAREFLLSRAQETNFELEQLEQRRKSDKLRAGKAARKRPQSARRRVSPRKQIRSPTKRRGNMKRPTSAAALNRNRSRKSNQFSQSQKGMKMRRSKSTQKPRLLSAARGNASKTRTKKISSRGIKSSIKNSVINALLSLESVLDVGAMKMQNIGDGDVVIDTHILVDSRTTVKQAHKIATRARKFALRSHERIADVIVHVDAQQRLMNGRLPRDIEEDICSALATVKEIYSVAQANISRAGGRVIADVEILVNPELLMREVHYVARRVCTILHNDHPYKLFRFRRNC